MTYWSDEPAKVKYAKQYFASINPMASRIMDLQSSITKSIPKVKWNNLTTKEKENIIDKHFIKPEILKRYKSMESECLPKHYHGVFPKLLVNSGQVYPSRLDDDAAQESWKDEHSSPFSWETKSQMNIPLPPPSSKPKKKKIFKEPKRLKVSVHSVDENISNGNTKVGNKKLEKQEDRDQNGRRSFQKNEDDKKLKEPVFCNKKLMDVEKMRPAKDVALGHNGQLKSFETKPFSSNKTVPYNDQLQSLDINQTKNTTITSALEEPPLYKLPNNDVKKRSITKKSKPLITDIRNSLTLEDDSTNSQEAKGAIRNLEISLQKEQNTLKRPSEAEQPIVINGNVKDTPIENLDNLNLEKVLDFETSKDVLGDFSLEDKSPLMSLNFKNFETDDNTSIQKSGFDFLDNW